MKKLSALILLLISSGVVFAQQAVFKVDSIHTYEDALLKVLSDNTLLMVCSSLGPELTFENSDVQYNQFIKFDTNGRFLKRLLLPLSDSTNFRVTAIFPLNNGFVVSFNEKINGNGCNKPTLYRYSNNLELEAIYKVPLPSSFCGVVINLNERNNGNYLFSVNSTNIDEFLVYQMDKNGAILNVKEELLPRASPESIDSPSNLIPLLADSVYGIRFRTALYKINANTFESSFTVSRNYNAGSVTTWSADINDSLYLAINWNGGPYDQFKRRQNPTFLFYSKFKVADDSIFVFKRIDTIVEMYRESYYFNPTLDSVVFGWHGIPPAYESVSSNDRKTYVHIKNFNLRTRKINWEHIFNRPVRYGLPVIAGLPTGDVFVSFPVYDDADRPDFFTDIEVWKFNRKGELVGITSVNKPWNGVDLQTWPNPANALLHFANASASAKVLAQIYSANGTLIKQETLYSDTRKTCQLNIAALASGLYLLKIQEQDGTVSSTRFVKE